MNILFVGDVVGRGVLAASVMAEIRTAFRAYLNEGHDPSSAMELLNAETLARLAGVKLRARAVVEGVLSGLHKSPHQGQSVEFAEHKEYAPGDEVRHIDWKAYGKFDKYYVKRYEEETELKAYLVIDSSASMAYRGGGVSKLDYARTLAASGWSQVS